MAAERTDAKSVLFTPPNLLSALRLFLVPVLLSLAWANESRIFLSCLIVSLLSDAADGFLARKLHQTSALGAKLDSWGDFATYIALPLCGWWLRPNVILQEKFFLLAGISSYIAAALFGFVKFRALTSYHTWLGKFAAILIAGAVLSFFGEGPGWVFRIVMPLVALAELEEILITVVLTENQINVPSLWHALKIRAEISKWRHSS